MLGPGDFRAAKTSADAGLDALGAQAHGAADALLHGAAEGDTLLQLLRDVLCHQLSGQIRLPDFHNVDVDGLADHGLNLLTELVDLGAALADDLAGLRAVDVDSHLQRVALDLNAGNSSGFQFLFDKVTNFVIFNKDVAESFFICKPAGIPILNDAHTEPVGINFLAHSLPPLSAYSFSFKERVICEVLFRIRFALPLDRGIMRFMVGPGQTKHSATYRLFTSMLKL